MSEVKVRLYKLTQSEPKVRLLHGTFFFLQTAYGASVKSGQQKKQTNQKGSFMPRAGSHDGDNDVACSVNPAAGAPPPSRAPDSDPSLPFPKHSPKGHAVNSLQFIAA